MKEKILLKPLLKSTVSVGSMQKVVRELLGSYARNKGEKRIFLSIN